MANQKGRTLLEETLASVASGASWSGYNVTGSERMLAALAYTRLVDDSAPRSVAAVIVNGLRAMSTQHRIAENK